MCPGRLRKKRTIVLFLTAAASGALLSACASSLPGLSMSAPCPPPRTSVCDVFGPESRCSCADRHGVERALTRAGFATQTSAARW